MLQLHNESPFAAERAVLLDREGNKIWVVVVKATFDLSDDGTCALASKQEPVTLVPQYLGEAGTSTLLRETELVADHPGTAVTINGAAYAPPGSAVARTNVEFEAGSISKRVQVTGDRYWVRGAFGLTMTDPVPFQSMPITYERAFGGRHARPNGAVDMDIRNPAGIGYAPSETVLENVPVPNVEYPADPVRRPGSRPMPAGFSAIPASWSPRRELGGTFDDRWQKMRAPLWPDDYDPRHQVAAPWDQVSAEPLRGGETVVLRNLSPSGLLQFVLPRYYFVFDTVDRRGRLTTHRGKLDRVIIEPGAHKLLTVWRTTLNCAGNARAIQSTTVSIKRTLQ